MKLTKAKLIETIRKTFGFELQMVINGKNVTVHYDEVPESRNYILSINGIDEELFPDLVFKLVENFRVDNIKGKGLFVGDVDYL